MPDVFISYSAKDSAIARWLHEQLTALNVESFLAEINLAGGQDWKPEILKNLRESDFVLFLATPNSCTSDAVKHEIGGALILKKAFVPIMYGVRPDQLPAWTRDKQAVDIHDQARTRSVFEQIAHAASSKRFIAGLIVGVLGVGATYLLLKSMRSD